MEQSDVVDSISKHLDALAELIKWALLLALVFWWAGFERTDIVDAVGMKIPRAHALWVSVFAYIVVNCTVLVLILRIGDLVRLVDEAHLRAALSKLAIHPWPLNPFAYFGAGFISRFHSGTGFGSLIVVWWVCNASLYGFAEEVRSPLALLLQGVFLAIGLASMQAINRVYAIVLQRTQNVEVAIHSALRSTGFERAFFMAMGITTGGAVAYFTQVARFL